MNLIDIEDTKCNFLLNNKDLFNKKYYFEEPNKTYSILSISLQEVDNIDVFKKNIETYKNVFPNFYIRIYTNKEYDNKLFIDEYKNKEYIQIIEYEYVLFGKKYINNLIKYEPLFNFEQVINVNFVYVIDPNSTYINKNICDVFLLNESSFYFATSNSAFLNKHLYGFKDLSQTWCRIYKYGIMSKIKLPCYIYNDYLCMLSNLLNKNDANQNQFKTNSVMEFYDNLYEIYQKNKIKEKYEDILLFVVMNYLSTFNINFSYSYTINFSYLLYYMKNKQTKYFKNAMKFILKKDYNDKKNVNDNYSMLYNVVKNQQDKNYGNYVYSFIIFIKQQVENDFLNDYGLNYDFARAVIMPLYIGLKSREFVNRDDRILYTYDLF